MLDKTNNPETAVGLSSYERYKAARLGGLYSAPASRSIGVSATFGYRLEERLRTELPVDQYERMISPVARRHLRRREGAECGIVDRMSKAALRELAGKQKRTIASLAEQLANAGKPPGLTLTGEIGQLAETFVMYRLRRRGFQVFLPSCAQSGTDLLVLSNGVFKRCEVKSSTVSPPIVRTSRTLARKSKAQQRQVGYEPGSVDIFIFVDLTLENIFVVPSEIATSARVFTLTEGSDAWQYKDRFDLI